MAAAVSQLCVRQGSTLLDCFIQHKGCKVEQISPLFSPISLPLFQIQKSIHSVQNQLACQALYRDIYTEYGSRLMAKEEKSTFQISSLLLSSFISNIFSPEKGYYWQNQPNSLKVKSAKISQTVSRNQLQCQATTAYCTEKKFCPPQSSWSHRNQVYERQGR